MDKQVKNIIIIILISWKEEQKHPEEEKHPKKIYCLLYTSPSPRDKRQSRMPSSA